MKDPLRIFTRGIPEAIEGGPAFEAMFSRDDRVIQSSWGHIASQIVELDLAEPKLGAICDYLGISAERLANPDPPFRNMSELGYYLSNFREHYENKYLGSHANVIETARTFTDRLMETFKVEGGEERGDAIQSNIEELGKENLNAFEPDAKEKVGVQMDLLCLERDAYYSGVAMDLTVLIDAVFNSADLTSVFSTKEISNALSRVLDDLMYQYLFDAYNVPVNKVVLGKEQIDAVNDSLKYAVRQRARKYAQDKWSAIEHLFIAPPYYEHPLFTGNEH